MKFVLLASAILQISTLPGQLRPTENFPDIHLPAGFSIAQFADQAMVRNVTTLCLDAQGRVYVAETNRWRVQVQDIRHGGPGGKFLKERVNGDISAMTLADREAFHKHWSGKHKEYLLWEEFTKDSEVIKQLTDTDGDGKADEMKIFRDDFNDALAGPSGGLIEKDGTVYFAMIPGVYSLKDLDGDGEAEEVKTLIDGFGVRVSFSGHDMNGFAFGPDGKLYWSIGDRGYHVEQNGKTFARPDSGGVFRCNPDGSDFEEFYVNLRNPKEIVFDRFGNLFTVDNDYDKGDRERIVYLVEHGDSGWKMGHQTIVSFGNVVFDHLGPLPSKKVEQVDAWMNEGMWNTRHDRQPAHINPPIAYSVNGPCGFAYHPGVTSFGERYADSFFVVGYVASAERCVIENFTLKLEGAEFKLGRQENFLKGIALTDLDWGYDGKMYLSDYGGGWTKSGKGNIYTVSGRKDLNAPNIQSVKKLFAEGFQKLDSSLLFELLDHPDQRVRQRAQFALAERELSSLQFFQNAIKNDQPLMRRIHGIWGIGQLAQTSPSALESLRGLFQDPELEVRANTARTLGNHPGLLDAFQSDLIAALDDPSLRVAGLAAIALANHGHENSVDPALAFLARNNDKDVVARHSGIMVLAKCAKPHTLTELKNNQSPAIRRAATVALRRQGAAEIAAFFDDPDTAVRQEAIRGAYDENIRGAFAALSKRAHQIAKRVTPTVKYHPLSARRSLYAAWTLAQASDLETIVGIVNDHTIDSRVRRDAIVVLLDWDNPPVADPVTGFVRTLPQDRTELPNDLQTQLASFFKSASSDAHSASLLPWGLKLAQVRNFDISPDLLTSYLEQQNSSDEARLLALDLLAKAHGDDPAWKTKLEKIANGSNAQLRSRARALLLKNHPGDNALALLIKTLNSKKATLAEKQATLKTLGTLNNPEAHKVITNKLGQLKRGKLAPGLGLDIVMAAETMKAPSVQKALADFRATLPQDDPLAEWFLLCETGGDSARGKTIFYDHGVAQCLRCHKMHGTGGDVGPELGAIGKTHDLKYLLRSLITPASEVAEGFGVGSVTLKDGTVISGMILAKDKDGNARVKIGTDVRIIPGNEIEKESKPMSSMPPMAGILNKSEVRDMVAFLKSCVEDKTDDEHK
ncbi:MAG: DUF7133 domain-containing protein [Akkermansiaceae bacterium]